MERYCLAAQYRPEDAERALWIPTALLRKILRNEREHEQTAPAQCELPDMGKWTTPCFWTATQAEVEIQERAKRDSHAAADGAEAAIRSSAAAVAQTEPVGGASSYCRQRERARKHPRFAGARIRDSLLKNLPRTVARVCFCLCVGVSRDVVCFIRLVGFRIVSAWTV